MSISIISLTGGQAKIQIDNVDVITVDKLRGIIAGVSAGSGPAFRVYAASTITALSTTDAKINFDTKTDGNNYAYDTANAFDLTNDRFQPQVAGYYQFTGAFVTAGSSSQVIASLRKNGVLHTVGIQVPTATRATVSDLIYLNGSSDYVELFGFSNPGQNTSTGAASTYFSGFLARIA